MLDFYLFVRIDFMQRYEKIAFFMLFLSFFLSKCVDIRIKVVYL